MKPFEVGDRVYCERFGYGTVTDETHHNDPNDCCYPVKVQFKRTECFTESFTLNGVHDRNMENSPVLRHANLESENPRFKEGQTVWSNKLGLGEVVEVLDACLHAKFDVSRTTYLFGHDGVFYPGGDKDDPHNIVPCAFKPGDRVTCKHFGDGKVLRVWQGLGTWTRDPHFKVEFDSKPHKTFNFDFQGVFLGRSDVKLSLLTEGKSVEKYNVGDKVFTLMDGFGEIKDMGETIFVLFSDYYERFTPEGKTQAKDKHPSLLTLDEARLLGYEPEPERKEFFIALLREKTSSDKPVFYTYCAESKQGLEAYLESEKGKIEILDTFRREAWVPV